jgi:hypothetical protein
LVLSWLAEVTAQTIVAPSALDRWCLIQSYLTSARHHGLTVLDAITRALDGKPWLPATIAA